MQLAIDVGNTHLFLAFYENDKIIKSYIFGTYDDIYERFKEINLKPLKIGISSVVPAVNNTLRNACLEVLGIEPYFISYYSKHGLKISIPDPEMMGSDLIVAASKASDLHKNENIILFDLGTATSVSVITLNKEFMGGMIIAGLETSLNAIGENGALLPKIFFNKEKIDIVAKKTENAMITGAYYSHLGAIRYIAKHIKREYFNAPAITLGTGGNVKYFKGTNAFDVIYENLITDGIIKIMNC